MTDQSVSMFRPPLAGALNISQTFDEHIAYGIEKGYKNYNPAIDYAVPANTPVYAARQGLVTWVEYHNPGYGHMVIIDHDDNYQSIYAHLDYILVTAGQSVERGQFIARSGNTGRSTGPHLHFEVRLSGVPIDPAPLFLPSLPPSKGDHPGVSALVSPGEHVSPFSLTYLRTAPAININTAITLCQPNTPLMVEQVLSDPDGNTWLKLACYICQTYQGEDLVYPIQAVGVGLAPTPQENP